MKKRYSEKSTYVIRLAPLEKALLDYINRRYMFYEFLIERYYYLFKAIPKPSKRIYAYIPLWLYEYLRSHNIRNSVSMYLVTVTVKNLFNTPDTYRETMKAVRVYDTFADFFGKEINVAESVRPKLDYVASLSYAWHPTKVFAAYSQLAYRVRWCKKRYRLTRRNALLLYLAYFTLIKEKMAR